MNGALQFAINMLVIVIGVFGSLIMGYTALRIVRDIKTGVLEPRHLVSDKGTNAFSLHKVGQLIGMLALTLAFIFTITHVRFEDESVGGWIYWLFAAYGTIMVLPQAWVNFLNRGKPMILSGSGDSGVGKAAVDADGVTRGPLGFSSK